MYHKWYLLEHVHYEKQVDWIEIESLVVAVNWIHIFFCIHLAIIIVLFSSFLCLLSLPAAYFFASWPDLANRAT